MSGSSNHDYLSDFSHAVAAYLNVMAVTADALDQAFPEVGGPYRQRIQSLRSRVAFDASRDAIKGSAQALQAELKDYASVANRVLTQRSVEMERRILAFGQVVENLTQLQVSYGNRLGSMAARLECVHYPEDRERFSQMVTEHASNLRGLSEEMSEESVSMLARMRDQMIELDRCLAGTASTDPATGLINRREFDRQMEAHGALGATFSLLLFELSGPLSDQVLRMAADKLAAQFRHNDRVGRWGSKEFAVLFLGGPELAETRAAQVAAAISGRYTLANGETVLVEAQARLLQRELAPA